MNNQPFRKSSMERLNSPEQLNEYIRVAKPGVWLMLAAITLLLIGVLVWSIFGLVQTRIECGALVIDGEAMCCVDAESVHKIKVGNPVTIADVKGKITDVSFLPVAARDEDAYLLRLSGLSSGEAYCTADVDVKGLEDGIYPAVVTIESLHPISFIIR